MKIRPTANQEIDLKKLFVGNLPFNTYEQQLEDLFEQYGDVQSVRIITDRETGRSRGFGFVEMDAVGADSAISQQDGVDFEGRSLRVSEALERQPRERSRDW